MLGDFLAKGRGGGPVGQVRQVGGGWADLAWPDLAWLAGLGSGYFFVRVVCIAFAAARPSPIARITVAPPRTMSPPA